MPTALVLVCSCSDPARSVEGPATVRAGSHPSTHRPAAPRSGAGTAQARQDPNPPTTQRPVAAPSAGLDLLYQIDAARPRTSLSLHVSPTGEAELTLRTSPLPVPTAVLGRFRATLPASTWQRIEQHVSHADLLRGDRGESATAEGSGSIVLSSGSRRAALGLATSDASVLALRAMLDGTLTALARHPVAGVRLRVEARRAGGSLVPSVVLEHVGDEPVDLVLCDTASAGFCASASVRVLAGAREIGATSLPAAQMVAAARAGTIPGGRFSFVAGHDIRLELPRVAVPADATPSLRATLGLWFAGPGLARSFVRLEGSGGATGGE